VLADEEEREGHEEEEERDLEKIAIAGDWGLHDESKRYRFDEEEGKKVWYESDDKSKRLSSISAPLGIPETK